MATANQTIVPPTARPPASSAQPAYAWPASSFELPTRRSRIRPFVILICAIIRMANEVNRHSMRSPLRAFRPSRFVTATLDGEAGASTSSARAWTLPSKILQVAELRSQDGCIWRVDGAATLPDEACTPLVVVLGPLFKRAKRLTVEGTKLKYTHNLIRRAHQDVEEKLTAYLTHIGSMEAQILQRYDPMELEYTATGTDLVETMVLDGLFIIEVLINHWTRKRDQEPISVEMNMIDFTTQPLRWEPNALRLDLIVVQNQIPFFVLEKLFCMTDIPELGENQKKPTKLKQIILDYLIGDTNDAGLADYQGPVYHILHLVYLYLTFSRASALPVNMDTRTWDKLAHKAMDLRALFKRTFSCSSNLLPVGWKQWKVIPPLRELVRVGVKLKRAETAWFAQVKFNKKGVLEIPPLAWGRYHIRLLTNLVVLEMSGWWPADNRLFCSYVRFMAELIVNKKDATLLFKKGIIQEINEHDIDKNLLNPFRILADYSHGSKYDFHFNGLVDGIIKCYQKWSNVDA
ncbi:UPF0481 protein At3g47200-like [Triticum dicoccoides]|uniref:UPF0481 protein At3g47200-like n=1 Tax=Triticum dicoccoides TaxID=85692 RepID=UPI00188FF9A8|nr:UPF0481 protein At3g47200-like [Triticum dicoccoides]